MRLGARLYLHYVSAATGRKNCGLWSIIHRLITGLDDGRAFSGVERHCRTVPAESVRMRKASASATSSWRRSRSDRLRILHCVPERVPDQGAR